MESYQIIGNVSKDPETRIVNGKDGQITVCTFNVAINSRRRGTTEQNDAKFVRVTAWRKLGEICQQYIHKGNKVYISGTVEARAYTDKNGQAASSLEMTAQDVEFLTSKNASGQSNDAPAPSASPAPNIDTPAGFTPVDSEGLPF